MTTIVKRTPNFDAELKGDPLAELINYLAEFRNKFAHLLELRYQIPLEKELPNELIELYSKEHFFTYQEIHKDGSYKTILTRDLINRLFESIRFVIRAHKS